MDYVLRTKALCKKYKDYKALNGLSMNVSKGSIYGFVGKNGAGKTTLIRLNCGLQEPTSGKYMLYGTRNTDKEILKARRRMGAVVETPSIYLDMTAEDNLKQQYAILGLPSYDGLEDILKLVRLVKEISAKELEAACRKCIRLEVSNTRILSRVLDGLNVEYTVISDKAADVYAKINVSKLTLALAKENCEVISMRERDERLESYYIGLVGGKENE